MSVVQWVISSGVDTSSPTDLTQADLDSLVSAAIAQWTVAGASASQIASLYGTSFTVADLTGNALSEITSPGHVTIDIDAAGQGWFIDPTPFDNLEFPYAQDAAGTHLLTDPTSDAAGHIDLLTVVMHELGHVLGLNDGMSPGDADDLMYFDLLAGERRIPDAIDIALAPTTTLKPTISLGPLDPSVSIGPADQSAGTGNPGNDIIDASRGGGLLFGGGGTDIFVFANVDVDAATARPVTHVVEYHFAEGDTFDFSALTSPFHYSDTADASLVRVIEDPSGSFATLQVNTNTALRDFGPHWTNVAQIDGVHSGDAVNVLVDSHSAVHLAQIHVGLLV